MAYAHYTGENMLRASFEKLLRHRYEMPVDGRAVTVGLDVRGVTRIGPAEPATFKTRHYTQAHESEQDRVKRSSQWFVGAGLEAGQAPETGPKFVNRAPYTYAWDRSTEASGEAEDVDETNRERSNQPYVYYKADLGLVLTSRLGRLRVTVPDGLYFMLPADPALEARVERTGPSALAPVEEEPASGPLEIGEDEGHTPSHAPVDVVAVPSGTSQVRHEMVRPVADPVPPEQWQHRRAEAQGAQLVTERFVPMRGKPLTGGWLPGERTWIRATVRRIQAEDSRWVRDVALHLPVRLGEGFTPEMLPEFQRRWRAALDDYFNSGLLLPRSGDQLHIGLRLAPAADGDTAIELSMTPEPGRSNQLDFRLRSEDPALDPAELRERQRRNDLLGLHELAHFVGLPDTYFTPGSVFRDTPAKSTDTGIMAGLTTAPDTGVPRRYLEIIEDTIDSGPVVRDHPLPTFDPVDRAEVFEAVLAEALTAVDGIRPSAGTDLSGVQELMDRLEEDFGRHFPKDDFDVRPVGRVEDVAPEIVEALERAGLSRNLIHPNVVDAMARGRKELKRQALRALARYQELPLAERFPVVAQGTPGPAARTVTIGDYAIDPTVREGLGGGLYQVTHRPTGLRWGFGGNREETYHEVFLGSTARELPAELQGLKVAFTGGTVDFADAAEADDRFAPTTETPEGVDAAFGVADRTGTTWYFTKEGVHNGRTVRLSDGTGSLHFPVGPPESTEPRFLDTTERRDDTVQAVPLGSGRIALRREVPGGLPLEHRVYHAHGALQETTIAVRRRAGVPTGEHWRIDHLTGTASLVDATGTQVAGRHGLVTVGASPTGALRLASQDEPDVVLFEQEPLSGGHVLQVDRDDAGTLRWTEFDPAGNQVAHGRRTWDARTRTFHDTRTSRLPRMNLLDVRTYHPTADGGVVRARQEADGTWTWTRFGADGTALLSGTRRWNWTRSGYKDVRIDPETGREVVARRSGEAWPFVPGTGRHDGLAAGASAEQGAVQQAGAGSERERERERERAGQPETAQALGLTAERSETAVDLQLTTEQPRTPGPDATAEQPANPAPPVTRRPRRGLRPVLDTIPEISEDSSVEGTPLSGVDAIPELAGTRIQSGFPPGFALVDHEGVPLPDVAVTSRTDGGFTIAGLRADTLHFSAAGQFQFRTLRLPGTDRLLRWYTPAGVDGGVRMAGPDGAPLADAPGLETVAGADGGLTVRTPAADGPDGAVLEWHLDADAELRALDVPLRGDGIGALSGLSLRTEFGPGTEAPVARTLVGGFGRFAYSAGPLPKALAERLSGGFTVMERVGGRALHFDSLGGLREVAQAAHSTQPAEPGAEQEAGPTVPSEEAVDVGLPLREELSGETPGDASDIESVHTETSASEEPRTQSPIADAAVPSRRGARRPPSSVPYGRMGWTRPGRPSAGSSDWSWTPGRSQA